MKFFYFLYPFLFIFLLLCISNFDLGNAFSYNRSWRYCFVNACLKFIHPLNNLLIQPLISFHTYNFFVRAINSCKPFFGRVSVEKVIVDKMKKKSGIANDVYDEENKKKIDTRGRNHTPRPSLSPKQEKKNNKREENRKKQEKPKKKNKRETSLKNNQRKVRFSQLLSQNPLVLSNIYSNFNTILIQF